ncbi:MAG: archease [Candidatus Omnitrophota bacterium]
MQVQNKQTKFKYIPHTADIGLRISGTDNAAVFINAAIGMFSIIAKLKQPEPTTVEYQIKLNAANLEELLVAWLSELLTLSDIHNLFFTHFQINHLSASSINARVQAVKINSQNIEKKTEIKAVTYNELSIKQEKQRIIAKVFFDI